MASTQPPPGSGTRRLPCDTGLADLHRHQKGGPNDLDGLPDRKPGWQQRSRLTERAATARTRRTTGRDCDPAAHRTPAECNPNGVVRTRLARPTNRKGHPRIHFQVVCCALPDPTAEGPLCALRLYFAGSFHPGATFLWCRNRLSKKDFILATASCAGRAVLGLWSSQPAGWRT